MGLDTARWLDVFGKCVGCRKKADGDLRDHRNDSLGPYCFRCGDKAIKKAIKQAEAAALETKRRGDKA